MTYEPLRCDHCHDVIGVYEPLVAMIGGIAETTSLARDPELAERRFPSFHRHCFEQLEQRDLTA